jgi:AcrR family transcriptional regulator
MSMGAGAANPEPQPAAVRGARLSARERILAAAVERIARDGIDDVRIARIAMAAGVSSSLVHYHFATREALLAEAIEYSYGAVGAARTADGRAAAGSHAEHLAHMVEQCLPSTPELERDWVLWVELWLRAVRHDQLRPVAEELYARMRDWFTAVIRDGVAAGEFARCDAEEVADRAPALIDGFGIRTLLHDRAVPLDRARRAVGAVLARDLGLGEQLPFG